MRSQISKSSLYIVFMMASLGWAAYCLSQEESNVEVAQLLVPKTQQITPVKQNQLTRVQRCS